MFVDPINVNDRWAPDLLKLWGLTIPEGSPSIENVWHGKAKFTSPATAVHQEWLTSKETPYPEMRSTMQGGVYRKYDTPPPEDEREARTDYCDIRQGRIVPKLEGEDQILWGPLAKFVWEWILLNLSGWRKIFTSRSFWIQEQQVLVCMLVYLC
jgi:hypothetical protein